MGLFLCKLIRLMNLLRFKNSTDYSEKGFQYVTDWSKEA